MKRFVVKILLKWNRIVSMGIPKKLRSDEQRRMVLTNSLNLTVSAISLFILLILSIEKLFNYAPIGIGFIRMALLLLLGILNIYLMRKGLVRLAKAILIFATLFLLVLLPTLFRLALEEVYYLYPYAVVGLSVIPATILNYREERTLLYTSLIIYFVHIFFIDNLVTWMSEEYVLSADIIHTFYFYYKLYPLIFFVFLQSIIFSYRRSNDRFEKQIILKNKTITESSRKTELLNEQITSQKEEIEAQRDSLKHIHELLTVQNNDLKKSIEFASHIQTTILPSRKEMDAMLDEYFIVFYPRDVVSGDFYWISKKGKYKVIILSDCTGHGVPGAFISLLGVNIIQDVINSRPLNSTRFIMDAIRERLIKENEGQDVLKAARIGMDMSLLIINSDTNEACFSGAQHRLFMINRGKYREIRGDRMPVDLEDEKIIPFSEDRFVLNSGDRVYLSSDGFVDQFGGPDNKKFGYRRFRELIRESATLPVTEQEKNIRETFRKWKGLQQQIDDVLMIGFRVS